MISNNRFPLGFERDGKMSRNNENKTALLTSTLPEMGQIKGHKLSLACHVFMRGEGHDNGGPCLRGAVETQQVISDYIV